MVVCPYLMEFWADSCSCQVRLLFWPWHALTWQKWFSMTSWFTMAGFIMANGNDFSLMATSELKPSTMDCKSNHSFFSWEKTLWVYLPCPSIYLGTKGIGWGLEDVCYMLLITYFSLNSETTLDVCVRSSIVVSTKLPYWPLVRQISALCRP